MTMWQRLKNEYGRLRHCPPGNRFCRYVAYRRSRRGPGFGWSRVGSFAAGIALILLGVAIGWLPGPGGFIAFFGLALIALEFPVIARLADRGELWLRASWRRLTTSLRRWIRSRRQEGA
ncbi:PGPGW domain-containing protein [Roseimaritima sediminicola]|uniref:PGPGW domain-containing protein n=1 Tax=Roseimaritima sediminicola TaxID=2662066 RepID=UPI00129837FF|nr:PGPGW domain-containing protein [Roseimaritima sediminicola]